MNTDTPQEINLEANRKRRRYSSGHRPALQAAVARPASKERSAPWCSPRPRPFLLPPKAGSRARDPLVARGSQTHGAAPSLHLPAGRPASMPTPHVPRDIAQQSNQHEGRRIPGRWLRCWRKIRPMARPSLAVSSRCRSPRPRLSRWGRWRRGRSTACPLTSAAWCRSGVLNSRSGSDEAHAASVIPSPLRPLPPRLAT